MKLRQKTLIVITTAIASLIVVLCTTASMMLLYDFQDLEADYVRIDVVRGLNGLDEQLSNLMPKLEKKLTEIKVIQILL
ncbi:MAG: hypothetical protein F6K40_36080 [Okeania sp. SIO3I5]|uniref:hypothetical protein n=1 Tax=Okeania sp. SIO3I5 TaxID=2607805 RepID=UPI0013B7B35A|nr:hypothetical protein [Okeania sp. SIO3I5]NEQ41327.1 hypothetical protein [Okeania sp. SIO3I5]